MENKFCLECFDEGYVLANPRKGPEILFIELTTRCNLNCLMCYRNSWQEVLGDMDEKLFSKILEDAGEAGVKFIWLAGWGEPLIHPKFLEFAEMVKEKGFKLGINTNGLLLDEDVAERLMKIGIDRLAVSVDAANPEIYGYIRRADFNRLMTILKTLHATKKKIGKNYPILEFAFTLMASNVKELVPLADLAEKHGVGRIIVSNVIPVTRKVIDECIYTLNGKVDVEKLASLAAIKSLETNVSIRLPEFSLKTERKCYFIENGATCVTWNGRVAPCYNFLHSYTCFIYGREKNIKQIVFGDLNNEKLLEVWFKPEYVKFRYKVRFFRYPSCTDCKFHDICDFAESNLMDCWGNEPSCADCLYSRGIVQCPI
ncbi:MAG: tungsten cofactor oxidoreductase radical SAM maturase [Thermoproteales archaeon]|nr:tungsten cofactor oxidoreductase radical SAM maturase [Thermoproteales archaeon]